METIKLWEKVSSDFKARDKEQGYKFLTSYALANEGSLDILERYKIKLTKSSQGIVLTLDPKTLLQALDLSERMKFIDAYREDPKRLTQLVTNVIKRMAKCDALGIPYKDENGRFSNFLFSERGFNAHMISLGKEPSASPEVAPEIQHSNVINVDFERGNESVEASKIDPSMQRSNVINVDLGGNSNIALIKEYALRVLEQFGITEKQGLINNRIDELANMNMGIKDTLMEAFKVCAGNMGLVEATIDELLEEEKNKNKGKAA